MVQANTTLINKILTITNASKSMVHCYTPGVNLLVEIPARKFENNINLTSSSAYSQLTALHLALQSYFPINEVIAEPQCEYQQNSRV